MFQNTHYQSKYHWTKRDEEIIIFIFSYLYAVSYSNSQRLNPNQHDAIVTIEKKKNKAQLNQVRSKMLTRGMRFFAFVSLR